jgi:hypothetical protein
MAVGFILGLILLLSFFISTPALYKSWLTQNFGEDTLVGKYFSGYIDGVYTKSLHATLYYPLGFVRRLVLGTTLVFGKNYPVL